MGVETGRNVVYVDAFLSNVLADPHAALTNYRCTRALSGAVFRKVPSLEGFFYPSIRDRVGMNFLLATGAFDDKGQVMSSRVVEVIKRRRFGFYDYRPVRHARGCDECGFFQWLPKDEWHDRVVFGMTDEEQSFMRSRRGMICGDEYFDFLAVATTATETQGESVPAAFPY